MKGIAFAYFVLLYWKFFQILDGLGSFCLSAKQLKALDSQQVLVLVYTTIQSTFLFLSWLFLQSYFKYSPQNTLPANFRCWQCKYQGNASIYISRTQLRFSSLWDWNYKSSSCVCSTALYLAAKFSELISCFSFNNLNNISLVKYVNGSWKTEMERCVQLVSELLLSMLAPLLCTKTNPFPPFPSAHNHVVGYLRHKYQQENPRGQALGQQTRRVNHN